MHRELNVVIDIGYGDREYWAFTNDYGQTQLVQIKTLDRWWRNVEGQEHGLIEVAFLASFLFYRYKFLSQAKDKNLYRLREWTRT